MDLVGDSYSIREEFIFEENHVLAATLASGEVARAEGSRQPWRNHCSSNHKKCGESLFTNKS